MRSIPAAWRERAAEIFSIDLRTLALFRAGLGAVVFCYAVNRLGDANALYTDWGVLPRHYLTQVDAWSRLSLYFINGELWFAALLLLLTALSGLALLVGYRTRLSVVAAFVLFASLINRNPIVLIGGDCLLACLLFWSLFLPLGARWSVDAALSTEPPPRDNRHVSAASVGLLLQVLSVWFFSAIMKSDPVWWPDGTAVWYTMELERYASPLGRALLLPFPWAMQALSYYVYFLEWLGPLLALSPWFNRPLRFAAMLCLAAMHTGFILFMEIGHFPFVSLTSLTTLLGGWFWDWRARANEAAHPQGPRIHYDRDCGFCLKSCLLLQQFLILPRASIAPAQDSQRAKALLEANYSWVVIDTDDRAHIKWSAFVTLLRYSPLFGWLWPIARWRVFEKPGDRAYDFVGRHRGAFGALTGYWLPRRAERFEVGRRAQAFAGVVVALVLLWNLGTIYLVPRGFVFVVTPAFRLLRIDQIWNMFAPYPSRLDGWAVFPGKLEDGTAVDVLRPGQPLSWERPAQLSQVHENIAWHTYRWRILERQYAGHRLYYGKYLCRQWNWDARPGKRLLTFEMAYLQELTQPPGTASSVERRTTWHHDCHPQDTEREKKEQRERKHDPLESERSRPV